MGDTEAALCAGADDGADGADGADGVDGAATKWGWALVAVEAGFEVEVGVVDRALRLLSSFDLRAWIGCQMFTGERLLKAGQYSTIF